MSQTLKSVVCLQSCPVQYFRLKYKALHMQTKSFTVFLQEHFFYPINLIVAHPLNQNKLQLRATFENWG